MLATGLDATRANPSTIHSGAEIDKRGAILREEAETVETALRVGGLPHHGIPSKPLTGAVDLGDGAPDLGAAMIVDMAVLQETVVFGRGIELAII